jgi:hypothetical protein
MKNRFLLTSLTLLFFIVSCQPTEASTNSALTYTNQAAVEKRVREYFVDLPVMIEIARCESNFRQYTDAGNPLRGGYGGQMVGLFQFYETVHKAGALALGYDLSKLDGNLAYARHVYESQGTTPWNSSRSCWGTVKLSPVNSVNLVKNAEQEKLEQIALLNKLITLLQQQLKLQKTGQV